MGHLQKEGATVQPVVGSRAPTPGPFWPRSPPRAPGIIAYPSSRAPAPPTPQAGLTWSPAHLHPTCAGQGPQLLQPPPSLPLRPQAPTHCLFTQAALDQSRWPRVIPACSPV